MQLSLTVEETNKLRLQVGLKLIPVAGDEPTSNFGTGGYKEEVTRTGRTQQEKKIESLQANMAETRRRLQRDKYVSKGGILDRSEQNETESDWLSKVGTKPTESETPKPKVRKSKKLRFKGSSQAQAQTQAQTEELKDGDIILTLKDKDINDDSDDEFENADLQRSKKKETEKDVEDAEEINEKQRQLKHKLITFDDSDEDENEDLLLKSDYSKPKKLKKRVKRDSQRVRKAESFGVDAKDLKKVVLVNEDLENEDSNELNNVVAAVRRRKMAAQKPVVASETVSVETDGIVVDEDTEFLGRFNRVRKDDPESKASQPREREEVHLPVERNISQILEESRPEGESLGISSSLNLLKSEPKKPSDRIEIVYKDDNGRVLNQKEAYKYMSHKFHGFKKA